MLTNSARHEIILFSLLTSYSNSSILKYFQRKDMDYCFEENNTCSGAAGVNFGIAATAASFIASRIFA